MKDVPVVIAPQWRHGRSPAWKVWLARAALTALSAAGALIAAAPAAAQVSTPSIVAPAADDSVALRTTSLPAEGLFMGDQLSEAAKIRLTEVIIDALRLDVEVALMMPTGPWQIDGAGRSDRDLNETRLNALRTFLSGRGIDPKRIFIESRVDARISEPRLDIQLIGRPANN